MDDSRVEAPLKNLLEDILLFLENFLEDQNDLKIVEQQLKDYDNLVGLVQIIQSLFKTLMKKIEKKLSKQNDNSSYRSYRPEEEYEKLEQIIQKHEAEIRNHISLEQQMKIYTESLQQKIEDIEKELKDQGDQYKQQQNNHRKDIAKLQEQLKSYQKDNDILRQSIESLENRHIVYTDNDVNGKIKQSGSDHKFKKQDQSSEHPTNQVQNPYNTQRHSTPLKSQSQHQKAMKRNSTQQDSDLFYKYGAMVKSQLSQRSQVSQQKLNTSQKKNTLNIISDICNQQQIKRSKSQQGNTSKVILSQQNSNNNQSSNKVSKILDNNKTNEAIQRLLKLK
ncbi:hypothetical protein pb186bvf_016784 [Paramecium bursaria]